MSIYWIILFLILLFIELATVNLISIWFAIGALGAFVTAFFTDSILIQLLVFVVISVVSLFVTLPIVKKFKSKEKIVPTNLDRVIGQIAEVTREIKPNHYGEVEIFGTTWTASSSDSLAVGERVKVLKLDGVKLIVQREEKK
ncbi:MAG: NfeD family protein [bacterium]|nr:NfeD family protein [Mycoplasmatota bacterium]MDD6756552.1 NfeD family protein [bacterium]MDY2908191.1 NfeD family protein [Candidatus Faecimonas sp.]